jgi:hypothetical protein
MRGVWRLANDLVRRKPLGAAGGAVVLALLLVAVFADQLAPYRVNETSLLHTLERPSRAHWFGTDELGRDVYSRVIYGARVSMYVGLAATLISVALGAVIGGLSGYFLGRLDLVLQRLVDAWMAFPGLVMVIVLLTLLGPGLVSVIVALGSCRAACMNIGRPTLPQPAQCPVPAGPVSSRQTRPPANGHNAAAHPSAPEPNATRPAPRNREVPFPSHQASPSAVSSRKYLLVALRLGMIVLSTTCSPSSSNGTRHA